MEDTGIRTDVVTLDDFKDLLEKNQGIVILKFGAEWCKPCKKCAPLVLQWFRKATNPKITKVIIDVDESIEIYMFLKNKKMVNGIPTLLMYKQGNTHYSFDDSVSGSSEEDINAFFQRCLRAV